VSRAGRLLPAAHALVGAALLLAPGRVLSVLNGRRPGRAGPLVARVLGARHAGQALVLAARPDLAGWGAAVDALHAASMATYASTGRPGRRAAGASALVAALLALAATLTGNKGEQALFRRRADALGP
jgi:hypothetical protein